MTETRRPRTKTVIIGGSGQIGRKLAALLEQAGHSVVAASPSSGVDSFTGAGLAQALQGADTVVDVSNSHSFDTEAVLHFFQTSTRNLLAAETEAGVRHHVALTVVGAERAPTSGYLRAKVAQESLIAAGPVPYTIVRATQFFEFLMPIANAATQGQSVRVSSAPLQPIAGADVAAALAEVVGQAPLNGICEVAGPQAMPLDELIGRVLRARKDPRHVITDAEAPYFGARLDERTLIPGREARIGKTTLEQWLATEAAR